MDEIFSESTHGEKLCDSIFQFYLPRIPVQLEVVFIHGLEHGNFGDVYQKTSLARDGTPDNVWLMTWLQNEFPFAHIFALSNEGSSTDGRKNLALLGEKLLQEMVNFGRIGQNGVPVMFVCHGFGGLVGLQILLSAQHHANYPQPPSELNNKTIYTLVKSSPKDNPALNLLQNLGGFECFFPTPPTDSLEKRGPRGPSPLGTPGFPFLTRNPPVNQTTERLALRPDETKDLLSSSSAHLAKSS